LLLLYERFMKAVIFGTNDLASLLYYHLEKHNPDIIVSAFIVNMDYRQEDVFCGLPVKNAEEMTHDFPPEEYCVYICVGYKNLNRGRRTVYEGIKKMGYEVLNFIHPSAQVDAAKMGEGNLIMQNAVIDPHTEIGNCNIFLAHSMLAHHSIVGDFNFFSTTCSIAGRVTIGDECFFAVHSSTRDKISIGNRSLVGINASVTETIPDETIVAPVKGQTLIGKSRLAVL